MAGSMIGAVPQHTDDPRAYRLTRNLPARFVSSEFDVHCRMSDLNRDAPDRVVRPVARGLVSSLSICWICLGQSRSEDTCFCIDPHLAAADHRLLVRALLAHPRDS